MAYKTNSTIKKLGTEEDLLSEEQAVDYTMDGGSPRRVWGIVVAIIIVILAAWYLIPNYTAFKSLPPLVYPWPSNQWQAVFLTNGQVYFGKINKVTWSTVVLKDIYYLQVVTRPLQRTIEGQETPAAANQEQTTQELTLVKLGNELHGPTDEIRINSEQILFTEFLKNDGRVVDAINRYLQDLKKTK